MPAAVITCTRTFSVSASQRRVGIWSSTLVVYLYPWAFVLHPSNRLTFTTQPRNAPFRLQKSNCMHLGIRPKLKARPSLLDLVRARNADAGGSVTFDSGDIKEKRQEAPAQLELESFPQFSTGGSGSLGPLGELSSATSTTAASAATPTTSSPPPAAPTPRPLNLSLHQHQLNLDLARHLPLPNSPSSPSTQSSPLSPPPLSPARPLSPFSDSDSSFSSPDLELDAVPVLANTMPPV